MASCSHKLDILLLSIVVNVSVETDDCSSLVEGLGKTRSPCEGIDSGRSTHVLGLLFESLSVDCHRHSLSVVSLWHFVPDFLVRLLLKSSAIAMLH